MKRLLIVIAIVLIPSLCSAWTLSWTPMPEADGYRVSYGTVSNTSSVIDVGNNAQLDLSTISLSKGTRYEFYVQAYKGSPKSYGGESDHIRWTYPQDPLVIEMLGQPVNIVIQP